MGQSSIRDRRPRLSFHGHYVWIDALRGVAALAVVVFHYHHFYLADNSARSTLPDAASFPYAGLLEPLYRHGHFAVELFWVISGFVFAHVYLPRPATLRNFVAARVARLYPLHLATLLFVAALQVSSLNVVGHWQIYGNNDLRHFLLQLGLSSNWTTLSHGLSFNGPIWSVSLEIVAYAMFFLSLGLLRRWGFGLAAGLAALCLAIGATDLDLPLIRSTAFLCAAFFFTGTMIYFLHARSAPGLDAATLLGLTGLTGLALVAGWVQIALIGACAVIVLLTAMLDRLFQKVPSLFRVLGDNSYSIYLVHVPMQMAVLVAADLFFGGSRVFADSPLTLPVYVVAVFGLSWFVHVRYERPAGRYLRNVLERRAGQGSYFRKLT